MTNEQISLEKYTSHTLFERVAKGLCVRGELEMEQTATYWPQVPLVIAALLPHSAWLLNWGPEGPSPLSWAGSHCLELQLELQQTDSNSLKLSVAPGYIIVWRPPASHGHLIFTDFNLSTGQGDIFDIFNRMHLFPDWRLGQGPICYNTPYSPYLQNRSLTIRFRLVSCTGHPFVGELNPL